MRTSGDRTDQIKQIISHWPDLNEVADFALARHGFGDSDGGFGVVYASDLDEYDRAVDGADIPVDHVELYAFWGTAKGGYEFVIREDAYLSVLVDVLRSRSFGAKAEAVEQLADRLPRPREP